MWLRGLVLGGCVDSNDVPLGVVSHHFSRQPGSRLNRNWDARPLETGGGGFVMPSTTVQMTREDHLVVWKRPDDRWVSVCCYLDLASLIGPMKKGETVNVKVSVERL